MTERRCGDCEWFVNAECRRMPPTGIKPEIEFHTGKALYLNGRIFPLVRPDDWCGEFLKRVVKEAPTPPHSIEGDRVQHESRGYGRVIDRNEIGGVRVLFDKERLPEWMHLSELRHAEEPDHG